MLLQRWARSRVSALRVPPGLPFRGLQRRCRALGVVVMLVALTGLNGCKKSGGSDSSPSLGPTVMVTGNVTYDHVPHFPFAGGLDYSATQPDPVRGARVEIIDAGDGTTAYTWTRTDAFGNYAIPAPQNRTVLVRVLAWYHYLDGATTWDYRVVDNTQGQALYAMDSAPIDVAEENLTVDVHAPSGWGPGGYTGPRVAAPFAILDTIYDAHERVLDYAPAPSLPPLRVNWSVDNIPVDGDVTLGEIRTTYYSSGQIFVLGAEDVDTDEYDEHVIAHEFGHFVERSFSRGDSIGGSHSTQSRLDPRVAWSEGWANAFSGMVLLDPLYRDALGTQQGLGGTFDIESNSPSNQGWWSSGSVQSILYDLFDADPDGSDDLELGISPILEILEFDLAHEAAPVTIFAFLHHLLVQFPSVGPTAIDLAEQQMIDMESIDPYATGETHTPPLVDALPVFIPVTINGGAVEACSDDAYGTYNRVGVRRFVRFTVTTTGLYRFTANGPSGSDPDLVLHRAGVIAIADSVVDGQETFVFTLVPGTYVLEVYEYRNITDTPLGEVCFDVTITN